MRPGGRQASASRRTTSLNSLILPVLIVGGIGFKYLSNLPTGTVSHQIELAGIGIGLCSVWPRPRWSRSQRTATPAAPSLPPAAPTPPSGPSRSPPAWPSPHGSTHWFHAALAQFSVNNHVAAATYGTFFVLMVLTMTIIRTISVTNRAHQQRADLAASESRIARRFIHA